MRLRRSELTTPGSSIDMMAKASNSGADEVMLDLEDAVASSEKEAARAKIVEAVQQFDWYDTSVAVRINGLDHPNSHGDLIDVVSAVGDHVDTIIVPKITGPKDVYVVETLLSQLEAKHDIVEPIGIEVLIEETEAVQTVSKIAASSDRLEALIFGPADYSASQGVTLQRIDGHGDSGAYPGDVWHHVRNEIVVAARSNGVDAIDGPYSDFSNPDGYREECHHTNMLGFVGKWAIHPSQIQIANDVFSPSADAVQQAIEVIEAMTAGEESGYGAVRLDGEMIDKASVRRMRRTVDRAQAIGMVSSEDVP